MDEEEIVYLIKKRKVLRTQITKKCQKLNQLIQKDDRTEREGEETKRLLELVERDVSQLRSIHDRLEPIMEEEEMEIEIQNTEEKEQLVWELTTSFQKQSLKVSQVNPVSPSAVGSLAMNNLQSTSANINATVSLDHVKIPSLQGETFDGDFHKWFSFWDDFTTTIDSNCKLSKIAKLKYLKNALKGEALASINDFDVTEDNYELVKNEITTRYGDPLKLQDLHVRALHQLKQVNNVKDKSVIKELLRNLQIHCNALKRCNIDVDVFFPFIMDKLPFELFQEFNRRHDESRSVVLLLSFLKKEVYSLERWRADKSADKSAENTFSSGPMLPTAAVLSVTGNSSTSNVQISCFICEQKGHGARSCPADLTIQEKKDILLSKKRCFKCFKTTHVAADCPFPFGLCFRCNEQHFQSMCPKFVRYVKPTHPKVQSAAVTTSSISASSLVLLSSACLRISCGGKQINVTCLLDNGSQRSFLRRRVFNELAAIPLGVEYLTVDVFGGETSTQSFPRVQCQLEGFHVPNKISLELLVVDCPTKHTVPYANKNIQQLLKLLTDNDKTPANCYQHHMNSTIDVILGMDVLNRYMTGRVTRLNMDVWSYETIFGWILHGPVACDIDYNDPLGRPASLASHTVTIRSPEPQIYTLAKSMWENEHRPLIIDEGDLIEPTSGTITQQFRKSLTMENQRYVAKLPWKEELKKKLTSNFNSTFVRLRSFVSSIMNDPVKFEKVAMSVEEYERNGHAERVFYDDIVTERNIGSYLPSFAVYNNDKSTKIRIVFDASDADVDGLSLNECLYPGEDLSIDLLRYLLEFRERKWGFVADIRKAFLQIGLHPDDRDFVRFLWIDRSLPRKDWFTKPIIFRMTRVLFGVTSSPFMLRETIRHHIQKFKTRCPSAVETLQNNLYVDNVIISFDDDQELQNVKEDVIRILDDASLPVHQIHTNHSGLAQLWAPENDIMPPEISVLGLIWELDSDMLIVRVPLQDMIIADKITKRKIVSSAAAIFDPFQWLAPYTIRAKMIYQELWARKIDWDKAIPEDLEELWHLWMKNFQYRVEWRLPRYLLSGHAMSETSVVELHLFCNSSPRACAAVAYLVSRNVENATSTLIMAKTKLAPISHQSIPRLELLAALIAAKIAAYLNKHLRIKLSKTTCWSDSKVTLFWIKKVKMRAQSFVNNRVAKIRELTDIDSWQYCPGHHNPADLATKTTAKRPLDDDSIWWKGPPWLTMALPTWKQPEFNKKKYTDLEEHSVVSMTTCTENNNWPDLHIEDFSSWEDLMRTSVNLCDQQRSDQLECSSRQLHDIVEQMWIKKVQSQRFTEEIRCLKDRCGLKKASKLFKLNPLLDEEGVLRMTTRLDNGLYNDQWVKPIILPSDHHYTELYIKHVHVTNLHLGLSSLLLHVRQRFWVLKARYICKKVIRQCFSCASLSKQHIAQPVPPLPEFRMAASQPFSYVGVDMVGPIFLKDFPDKKHYIALFTCAITRAIHLELTDSLAAKSFVEALRRCVARRGVPSVLYSDNATYFQRANKDLTDCDNEVVNYCQQKAIEWKFITEAAPWWGGFWERLVRSIKEPLRRNLGKTTLPLSEFSTLLCEVEAVVNNRPLGVMYDDPSDAIPITPAMLVIGRPLQQLRLYELPDQMPNILEMIKVRRHYFEQVTHQIIKEYLGQLRQLHIIDQPLPTEVKQGELVLLDEHPKKQILWPVATITEVIKSRDGLVRTCIVETTDGRKLRRPVQLLIRLPADNDEARKSRLPYFRGGSV